MTTPRAIEEPFAYKTRSEQRLAWFDGLTRPLTSAEQDEYYAALHAIYQREWRRHKARQAALRMEREGGRFVLDERKRQDAETLAKVRREMAG